MPSESSSYAAIDTGTTLIGGPSAYISQIFANIPGSAPATGDFQGYYTFRKFSSFILSFFLISLLALYQLVAQRCPSLYLSEERIGRSVPPISYLRE